MSTISILLIIIYYAIIVGVIVFALKTLIQTATLLVKLVKISEISTEHLKSISSQLKKISEQLEKPQNK